MKILAIEASGPVAGCALMEDDILRAEYSIQDKMKHSRTLVPMMEEIRSRLELDLAEIDAVAVTKGPGSFTGLRIGAAIQTPTLMTIHETYQLDGSSIAEGLGITE